MIAHFHEEFGVERQVYFRSRPEANHPEVFALLQFVAHIRPANDPARDHSGELADDENPARILECPGHRAVLGRAVGVARIEAKAGVRFSVNDLAIHSSHSAYCYLLREVSIRTNSMYGGQLS